MKKTGIIVLIICAAVIITGFQGMFIVNETEQAIITQFGDFIGTVSEPGLHFKIPFIQKVHRFEKRLLELDAEPDRYITGDKKQIIVDHISRWRIVDPYEFFRTVRFESQALARLDDIIVGRLRQEVAKHDFVDLIREERESIMETVTIDARERASRLGIEIVDIRIKRTDLPSEVQESVFARMEAERNRIASRYRAEGEERAQEIRANADWEREIIVAEAYETSQILRGEGDAQAIIIYAEAFEQDPEFYSFVRSLEAYERFMDQNSTVILGMDNELFKYFRSIAEE